MKKLLAMILAACMLLAAAGALADDPVTEFRGIFYTMSFPIPLYLGPHGDGNALYYPAKQVDDRDGVIMISEQYRDFPEYLSGEELEVFYEKSVKSFAGDEAIGEIIQKRSTMAGQTSREYMFYRELYPGRPYAFVVHIVMVDNLYLQITYAHPTKKTEDMTDLMQAICETVKYDPGR